MLSVLAVRGWCNFSVQYATGHRLQCKMPHTVTIRTTALSSAAAALSSPSAVLQSTTAALLSRIAAPSSTAPMTDCPGDKSGACGSISSTTDRDVSASIGSGSSDSARDAYAQGDAYCQVN